MFDGASTRSTCATDLLAPARCRCNAQICGHRRARLFGIQTRSKMFCQHHRNRAATTRCIQRFNREKAAEIGAIILSGMDYRWKLWYDPRLRTSVFKACLHASGGLPSSSYFLHVLSNEFLIRKPSSIQLRTGRLCFGGTGRDRGNLLKASLCT